MFTSPYSICNVACQTLGALRIASFADNSKQAAECGFIYDLARVAELRARVWRFAIRRATLRPFTATTKRFIAPTWTTGTVYALGYIVQDFGGTYWICNVSHTATGTLATTNPIASATGNAPTTIQYGQPQIWSQYFGPVYGDIASTTVNYSAGELVYEPGSPDTWTISLVNNNLNNSTSNTTYWCCSVGASDLPVNFLSPVGPGVVLNGVPQNIFPLPNGYLRMAPQGPKVANITRPATTAGIKELDYQFENNYFVSATTGPITFFFVADISDVTVMDSMFCDALAYHIAYKLCETLTQSNIKLQAIGQAYQKFINDARNVNWIEVGNTEDNEDTLPLTQGPAGVMDTPGNARGGGGRQQEG